MLTFALFSQRHCSRGQDNKISLLISGLNFLRHAILKTMIWVGCVNLLECRWTNWVRMSFQKQSHQDDGESDVVLV